MKNTFLICALFTFALFSSCGSDKESEPEPEVPVVTPQTPFKTLNYLYSISGSKTVAGIHNREPASTPTRWTEEIKTTSGKYPGLWSNDFYFQGSNIANRSVVIQEAINQWKKGSMVNLMWHACNPANTTPCEWDNGQGVLSKLTDAQWTDLITDGGTINLRWKAMLDEVASHLQVLEDNGVEVLWRPLHEMNQGSFWWGGRPGANGTRKLYQITHDYLTKTKGLSNLIWVWDMQDFSTLANDLTNYNPGNEYWDVAALDFYDGSGFSQTKYNAMVKVANGKPIAIGECERLPTAEELTYQPKWTFFMGWSELVYERNTAAEIRTLLNSAKVISLDEMPGWR